MPLRETSLDDAWARLSTSAGDATRGISLTLAAVLLAGLGAASAAAPVAPRPPVAPLLAAPVVPPSPAPPAPGQVVGSGGRPVDVDPAATPGPTPAPQAAATRRPAAPVRVERWLPRGTGMWLHEWHRSEGGDARKVVARSQRVGLTHLFVQTGSTRKGWIGEEVLSELLPATRGTDLKVIAWDFPKLNDPEADARRLARAATWRRPGVPRVAAVAPDVETPAEGTHYTPARVRRYYATLRAALPADIAILATVPWPSEKRTSSYPYATTAPYADAWIPMAYWYNRSPATVTDTAMRYLARFGRPVMPVGQGYDSRVDAPYLPADPTPDKSVAAFVAVARRHGAASLSLWSWQTTGPLQWGVLERTGALFAPPASPSLPSLPPVPASPSAPAAVPSLSPSPAPSTAPSAPPPPADGPADEPAEGASPGPGERAGHR